MVVAKNLSNLGLFLVGIILATACNPSDALLDEYVQIPESKWHRDSNIVFQTLVEDTAQMYLLHLRIKYNKDYPLSNIYLHRRVETEEEIAYQDTIQIVLFDARGKMTGKGISNSREHEIPIGPSAVKFSKRDYYNFGITHLMRDSIIEGIEYIGLKIEAVKTP